ncbi:eCIS core domain-containing protein [Halopiger djelfimassiliensis]|uniref:eCIS core domain-containing protein n=1 Tax=Halopiger djelfimassiliensis TaxID=1293047 RepID=UPI000AF1BF69
MLVRQTQQALEEHMDDPLGDVRIYTGPQTANACQDINARTVTVSNHLAFNYAEYDPESPEGQFLLAHELAHVRQQTGAAISMMPQSDADLEIDPDPQLEREADRAAEEALSGEGALVVNRTDDHDPRSTKSAESMTHEGRQYLQNGSNLREIGAENQ